MSEPQTDDSLSSAHRGPWRAAFHRLGSPPFFYRLSGRLLPWFGILCALAFAAGLYGGLVLAPTDYQQGESYRIIYIHVPAAWMSMFVYMVLAITGGIGLIWRMKLAEVVARASAPIGACFTFIALATGAIWGKPMWGALLECCSSITELKHRRKDAKGRMRHMRVGWEAGRRGRRPKRRQRGRRRRSTSRLVRPTRCSAWTSCTGGGSASVRIHTYVCQEAEDFPTRSLSSTLESNRLLD